MNETTSQRSLTHLYIDVQAELESQLYNDMLDVDEDDLTPYEHTRRLPAPDLAYPQVFAYNDDTSDATSEWRVSCENRVDDADTAAALRLADALTAAARQARIMNASGRVLSVLDPSIYPDAQLGETRQLVLGREPDDRACNSFRDRPHLQGRPSGYEWGDEGYRFELVGRFQYLGEEIRDGRQYGIFAEVIEEPAEETHPTHTDVDGEDG